MTHPGTPHAYETQAAAMRNRHADTLRATEDELAAARRTEGRLRHQLTQTELILAAEEQNSIRELTAAIEAEQAARRYRAAWQSARRRAVEHGAAVDTLLDASEMGRLVVDTGEQIDAARATIDGAYRERAHLTAWLAALHPAVLAPAPDVDEPGWQILYLYAGGQQFTWHIHPRDAGLYLHVPHVTADDLRAQWDGRTTEAKYEAIRQLCTDAAFGPLPPAHDSTISEDEDGERNVACQDCPAYVDNIGSPDDAEAWAAEQVVTLPPQPVPPRPVLFQPCAAPEFVPGSTAAAEPQSQLTMPVLLESLVKIREQIDSAPNPGPSVTIAEPFMICREPVVEEIAAEPGTLEKLRDRIGRAEQLHPTLWQWGLVDHGPFVGLPLVADDTLPRWQIRLRPNVAAAPEVAP